MHLKAARDVTDRREQDVEDEAANSATLSVVHRLGDAAFDRADLCEPTPAAAPLWATGDGEVTVDVANHRAREIVQVGDHHLAGLARFRWADTIALTHDELDDQI